MDIISECEKLGDYVVNVVVKSVDSEQLVPMRHEGGKDEIGSMVRCGFKSHQPHQMRR